MRLSGKKIFQGEGTAIAQNREEARVRGMQ